jgi:phosphopantothenoylcysteine decarboxylase
MAKVLLGVTGSVAAIRTPDLLAELKRAGHDIKIVATQASLYFFDPKVLNPLDPSKPARNPGVVILDEDEWPGREAGKGYVRDDPVLHIELRRWADMFVIAPLDANTLAKLANGLCDNCLTCVWRAWDVSKPVILAPAMNTLMWEHPLTGRHFRQIAESAGLRVPDDLDLDGVVACTNAHFPKLRIVSPQHKRLACGDVGMGALAELRQIVGTVHELI